MRCPRRCSDEYLTRFQWWSGCLVWLGMINTKGYARRQINGKCLELHRVYFERKHGKIPKGYEIHHTCENRRCINEEHMTKLDVASHRRLHNESRKAGVYNVSVQ